MNRNIALKRLKVYIDSWMKESPNHFVPFLPFASLFVDWNSSFNQDYWVTRMFVSQTIQHEWLNFKINCAYDRSFFPFSNCNHCLQKDCVHTFQFPDWNLDSVFQTLTNTARYFQHISQHIFIEVISNRWVLHRARQTSARIWSYVKMR